MMIITAHTNSIIHGGAYNTTASSSPDEDEIEGDWDDEEDEDFDDRAEDENDLHEILVDNDIYDPDDDDHLPDDDLE
jgi:hypothetical protein